MVQDKNQPRNAYASVYFKNEKLATIMKYWTVDEQNTDAALGNTLYGAVNTFEREGRTLCRIGTGQSQDPTSETKTIFITCGRKYLRIDVSRLGQQGESATVTEVLE